MEFLRALNTLDYEGIINLHSGVIDHWDARQRLAGVYVGTPAKWKTDGIEHGFTWGDVARELAGILPGMITVSHSSGLSWVNGAGGCKGRIIPLSHWQAMREEGGYDVVRELLGPDVHPIRYATAGGAAGLLLKYACDPQTYDEQAEEPLRDLTHGYVKVDPGTFERCVQWDASGFYYQLLRHLPSPHCLPHGRGVRFYPLSEYQEKTWRNTLSAIQDAKHLRNAMVGVMQGGLTPRLAYCRDRKTGKVKAVYLPGKYGPLRAGGLTVVRMGYEICRAECRHSNSVYSIIDCVTLPNGGTPAIWPYLGIKYRMRLSGRGRFYARGSYRLGNYRTYLYSLGYKPDPEEGAEESPKYGPVSYAAQILPAGKEVFNGLSHEV